MALESNAKSTITAAPFPANRYTGCFHNKHPVTNGEDCRLLPVRRMHGSLHMRAPASASRHFGADMASPWEVAAYVVPRAAQSCRHVLRDNWVGDDVTQSLAMNNLVNRTYANVFSLSLQTS